MPQVFRSGVRVETPNIEDVTKKLKKIPDVLKTAMEKTLMSTVGFIKQEIPRLITRRYNISMPSLMDQSHRAKWSMKEKYTVIDGKKLMANIDVKGTRLPVMRFHVDPTYVPNQKGIPVSARQPVTISIKRGSIMSGHPNVFIARMHSGHIGVYRRKIPNPGGPREKRPDGQFTQLPISELHMISVPEMLEVKDLREKLNQNTAKFMRAEFRRQTDGKGMRFRG
jgi:hypothetical protein